MRCCIVTTGSGTGIETPTEKLFRFKEILDVFPLVVGAGVNPNNAYEQLSFADAAIIGSCFKPQANTELPVDKFLIKDLMDVARQVRKEK